MVKKLISKLVTKEDALAKLHSGQTMMIGDLLGLAAPDEIIDGMIEKGVKDLTIIAITTGKPDEGCGKLIRAKAVKKAITSHIGTNPMTREQMNAGTLEVEFVPQGTLAERIHCGGAGLGGCLTPTGIGTKVAEGKQMMEINGKEYLLELPLHWMLLSSKRGKLTNMATSHTVSTEWQIICKSRWRRTVLLPR